MDFMDLKCASCDQKYNEDRVPRNLECGHSLCRYCATQNLTGRKLCPECREKQIANSLNDLPVNYPLLRLIRTIASGDVDLSGIKVPMVPIIRNSPPEPQQDSWKCVAHDKPLLLLCCTCSTWICHDCTVVDHRFYPRGSCQVLELADAIETIRDELHRLVKTMVEELESTKRSLASDITMHDFCLRHCPSEQRSHSRRTQYIKSQVEEISQPNVSVVDQFAEVVRKLKDAAVTTTSHKDLTSSVSDLVNCKEGLKDTISKEKELYFPLLQTIREHLRMDLKMLAEGEDPLYAIIDDDRGSRWTKMKVKDDRLLLYSLQEGSPPKKGTTIPFDNVKKLLRNKRTTAFFEVGTEEDVAGRAYVDFTKDTSLIQQTVMMCTGEKGASYRNTCFYKYDSENNVLFAGDYENNDGSGGRPIVEGLQEIPAERWISHLTGAIVAEKESTRLHFHLGKIQSRLICNIIGTVVKGIDILQALSKSNTVSKLKIKDCGLFIPMKGD